MCEQNASYLAKHSELGSKTLNKIYLKITQKALLIAIAACKFPKNFPGSMPPDPLSFFLVSQSASNLYCRKKCGNYAPHLSKVLTTPLSVQKQLVSEVDCTRGARMIFPCRRGASFETNWEPLLYIFH